MGNIGPREWIYISIRYQQWNGISKYIDPLVCVITIIGPVIPMLGSRLVIVISRPLYLFPAICPTIKTYYGTKYDHNNLITMAYIMGYILSFKYLVLSDRTL